jgi:FkbM family methyltransferase
MISRILSKITHLARDLDALGLHATMQGARSMSGEGALSLQLPGSSRVTIRRRDSDYLTLRQVYVQQEYWFNTTVIQKAIAARHADIVSSGKTPVIVDAGANIGLASIWFSEKYPGSVTVAIEPDPKNYGVLKNNTQSHSDIIPIMAAIGSKSGSATLSNSSGQSWGHETARSSTGEIDIVTIDDALEQVKNGTLLIAKIDIEGFESDLFTDNLAWLDDVCAVFIEPHDWKLLPLAKSSRAFQKAFGERDFSIFTRGEIILYLNNKYVAPSMTR